MASHDTTKTKLLDLPVDIILLIFPYLDAASFLNLTGTCSALHKPDFTNDSAFWATLLRHDFRVANRPVIENDGSHWRSLYRRLRTQSKVFTWGNNEKGCLGHSYENPVVSNGIGRAGRRVVHRRNRRVRSPSEIEGIEGLGVISDLQCGGWSTTLLTSKGALYSVGVLDGQQYFIGQRPPSRQRVKTSPAPLLYPPGMPQPKDRHDPATAIKQFSSGRAHVLGLSDSGRIWSWNDLDQLGVHVKFLLHTTKEDGSEKGRGAVKKVVAGWSKSAALVEGTGIVIWEPVDLDLTESDTCDSALVMETLLVPGTGYVETGNNKTAQENPQAEENVGEVKNFVLLEECVLFSTSLGKVFVAQIIWDDNRKQISPPAEMQITKNKSNAADDTTWVTDVQGSFRKFAVFTKSGAVLTSHQDRLMPLLTNQSTTQRLFDRIPALQNKQVISIAFGDHHFHALHAPGHITSYGTEPQACGALGLGGQGVPEARLRGLRNHGLGGDSVLVPHAYSEGRRVWFEREKGEWITFLTSGGVDHAEGAERIRLAIGSPGINAQGEVSEWIEQQGRDWESKFNFSRDDENADGLGVHFALSVSAAGWHSGALVLVNEKLAAKLKNAIEIRDLPISGPEGHQSASDPANPPQQPINDSPSEMTFWDRAADWGRYFLGLAPYNVSDAAYDPTPDAQHQNPRPLSYGASPREGYRYIWSADHFPRLKLSDGTEMPGEVPFDEWRFGRPEWKLNWEQDQDQEDE